MLQFKSRGALLLLCGCLLLSRMPLQAQEASQEAAPKAMTEQMKTQLDLSDDQYKKVGLINVDFSRAMTEVRKTDADRSEKISRMKTLSQKRDAALREILTAEQFAKFREQKRENRKNMRERRRQDNE